MAKRKTEQEAHSTENKLGTALSAETSLKIAETTAKEAMPRIIQAISKKAIAGSCQHAKFLMDFLNHPRAEGSLKGKGEPEEESLAALLLRELEDDRAALESAG